MSANMTHQLVTTSGTFGFASLDEVAEYLHARVGVGVEMRRAEVEIHDYSLRSDGRDYASTLVRTEPIPERVRSIVRLAKGG